MIEKIAEKLRSKSAQRDGFTLIEVILSITVLSLVSIALLEMFTVSTKTNVEAGILDKAKSLCVEASEEYKADPTEESQYLQDFPEHINDHTSGKTTYTKYFDRKWAETTEADAEYILEIVSEKAEAEPMSTGYYPQTAVLDPIYIGQPVIIDAEDFLTIKLELDEDDSECRLTINSVSYEIDSGKIIFSDTAVAGMKTALIPIHLDCSGISGEIEITVENLADQLTYMGNDYEAVADIYLCDIGEGGEVHVNASAGIVTENIISTVSQRIVKYNADIRVKEKSSGRLIAETSVEKYWVEN
jgi:prepilin-type N-terminal cleavage/methylation domain-containing protein